MSPIHNLTVLVIVCIAFGLFQTEIVSFAEYACNNPAVLIRLFLIAVFLYVVLLGPITWHLYKNKREFKRKYNIKSLRGVWNIEKGKKVIVNHYAERNGDYIIYVDDYRLYVRNLRNTLRCVKKLRARGYEVPLKINTSE